MFKAEIVADSINSATKDRITTMKVVFPRMILAEFNTHRAFSRNSASSRAIPFNKMVKMVQETPFIPMKWMKEHKGMQGNDYFEETQSEMLTRAWLIARDGAVKSALDLHWGIGTMENRIMTNVEVSKQICNRLLEPFMWHTVLVTATEWENFFALRNNEQAEIHMQEIARLMMEAYNNSVPQKLEPGEWHVPFGDKIDREWLHDYGIERAGNDYDIDQLIIAVATSRCARISYETLGDDPKINHLADLDLYYKLFKSGHWSPFEHCARANQSAERVGFSMNVQPSNFKGWIQFRKLFNDENKTDSRIIKR